ncbi:MAG: DnaD domain protein [Oscillospiraceae bacterium]|nr:DnaD domain protein [Oscillospiraceae bacterium]
MLGHVLSGEDMKKLYGIYRDLNLPAEVILVLINFCIEESRRSSDPTHMPRMRYIEKVAYEWERSHIFTLEAAEAYMKSLTERRSASARVRRMLGLNDRRLTKSEENYIHSWLTLGFSPEAISIAYERTVDRTGKLAWRYMDSILNNWHSKGLHTESEIEAKDPRSGSKPAKRDNRTGQERTVPNASDIERLRILVKNMKKEGE